MKKKIIGSLVLATLAGGIIVGVSTTANAKEGINQSNQLQASTTETSTDVKDIENKVTPTAQEGNELTQNDAVTTNIDEQEAKEIALKHANLKESDATNFKIKLDTEDGITIYEVEFHVGTKEYDYDIHAVNGNIIRYDIDNDDDNEDKNSSNGTVSTPVISEDEALKIALTHASVKETEINNFTIKLEKDDEILEYDIEFYSADKEYDYTIDANTGTILESEVDEDNPDDDDVNSSNVGTPSDIISEDEAKKIALAKVTGAKDSQIRIHLEKEDGKYVYEGTIQYDNTEYEFEIDAQSGMIKEWDLESVDTDEIK